jgi:hypothetical protein
MSSPQWHVPYFGLWRVIAKARLTFIHTSEFDWSKPELADSLTYHISVSPISEEMTASV